MKPSDLFLVLSEIADEHGRHVADEPLVIPVLVDDVETRRDLLQHAAEFLGGVLLDVTSGRYNGPVAAFDDVALRAEVETGLAIRRPRDARTFELLYENEVIDARLVDAHGRAVVPSAADEQVLGVARSIFDARLEKTELAFLLYSEHTLDKFRQSAMLHMLTGLGRKPGLRLGSARTLVLFIQAELSRERHCQYNRGVRYSLGGERLIRRHAPSHLCDSVRKLTAARVEPLVLFLGAGFSASSGMPVGNSLRDDAIRRICEIPDSELFEGNELGEKLLGWAQQEGRDLLSARERNLDANVFAETLTLEQVVRIEREFYGVPIPQTLLELRNTHDARLNDGNPLGEAVYDLRRIATRGGNLVLITVNFDELIEHEDHAPFDIAVTDEEFTALVPKLELMRRGEPHPNGLIPLLKLHGTISTLETCVVADDATRFGISKARRDALMALVTDIPTGRELPWVYVGASMKDIDLDVIFSLPEFNESAAEWWVTPYPEHSVWQFVASKERRWVRQQLEHNLFQRTITETADAFFRELADQWRV